MRRQIWFGIIVCGVAVIPGFVLGGIGVIIINMLNALQIGSDPDLFFMRTLFGIEAPGDLLKWILFTALPAVAQGGIAGALAVYCTTKIYTGPNIDICAYTAGALYTGAFIVMLTIAVLNVGFQVSYLQLVLQIIGLWIGLVGILSELPKTASVPTTA